MSLLGGIAAVSSRHQSGRKGWAERSRSLIMTEKTEERISVVDLLLMSDVLLSLEQPG